MTPSLHRPPHHAADPDKIGCFGHFSASKRILKISLHWTCLSDGFWRQHATKTLPKWSPNPSKIQPKMLQNLMLCCEQWKLNPSKHSHTFAHFCLSKRQENHPKIVSETAFLLDALKNYTNIDFCPIFNRLGLQAGSKMAAQNPPKIDQKLWKSIIL